MRYGKYDQFKGRRDTFEKCYLWKRNKSTKDKKTISIEENPSGIFYAVEETPQTNTVENNANFHYKRKSITIKTYDKVDLEQDDVVKFNDTLWRVANFQRDEEHRNNQFAKTVSAVTYIALEG